IVTAFAGVGSGCILRITSSCPARYALCASSFARPLVVQDETARQASRRSTRCILLPRPLKNFPEFLNRLDFNSRFLLVCCVRRSGFGSRVRVLLSRGSDREDWWSRRPRRWWRLGLLRVRRLPRDVPFVSTVQPGAISLESPHAVVGPCFNC